jgi:hypothetical protein
MAANGRPSKTTVFMPEKGIIVIERLILVKEKELQDGWHTDGSPIFKYRDNVLMLNRIVFWVESFSLIQKAVTELNKQYE